MGTTIPDEDIKEHLERIEKLHTYVDKKGDHRKYYGALGGLVFTDNERKYALRHGLYIIVPSGESFDIIAPGEKYQPRVW